MELLCVLAAVAALFCGCAVLTLKCRVPASIAPLTALSAIVAVLTLAAMAGVLYPAAWLLYLLCLAGGVWVAASCRGSTGAAQRLFTPGSVLFWGMALAFTVYFFVREPVGNGGQDHEGQRQPVRHRRAGHALGRDPEPRPAAAGVFLPVFRRLCRLENLRRL